MSFSNFALVYHLDYNSPTMYNKTYHYAFVLCYYFHVLEELLFTFLTVQVCCQWVLSSFAYLKKYFFITFEGWSLVIKFQLGAFFKKYVFFNSFMFHFPLSWMVSVEKSDVTLILVPPKLWFFFYCLTALNTFLIVLVFLQLEYDTPRFRFLPLLLISWAFWIYCMCISQTL